MRYFEILRKQLRYFILHTDSFCQIETFPDWMLNYDIIPQYRDLHCWSSSVKTNVTVEINCSNENRITHFEFQLASHLNDLNQESSCRKIIMHDWFSPLSRLWIFSLVINDAESPFISVPVLCFLLCIMGQLHIRMIKIDFDTWNFVCEYVCVWMLREM